MKTLKFDFSTGDFAMKNKSPVVISGKEALKQWIEKILRTQFGKYEIYDGTSYGANISDLVIGGTYNVSFQKSELEREIRLALMQNEEITQVNQIAIKNSGELITAVVDVSTIYGDIGGVST